MGAGVTVFRYAFLTGFFPYTTGAHGLAGSAIGLLLLRARAARRLAGQDPGDVAGVAMQHAQDPDLVVREVRHLDDQHRTGEVYRALAAENWRGPWVVVAPDVDPGELAVRLLG